MTWRAGHNNQAGFSQPFGTPGLLIYVAICIIRPQRIRWHESRPMKSGTTA